MEMMIGPYPAEWVMFWLVITVFVIAVHPIIKAIHDHRH